MPKVSVIIPTYNRADVVIEAIQSVLNQTLDDLELIIVDDGSTDKTRQAVEAIMDPRIRYFYKQNSGPAGARNFGLKYAQSDFIAFLDHDDLWPPDYLKIMVGTLEEQLEYGLVYCPVTLVSPNGRRQTSYKTKSCKSGWISANLFKTGFVWTSGSVIRRNVLNGFCYDESLNRSYEDGDFFLRLSLRTPYLFVRQVEAVKRVHTANFSTVVGVQPTRILVLERFYYQSGGDKVVLKRIAMRKLSQACRSAAKANCQSGHRRAALTLYKKAVKYNRYDVRLWAGLVQSFMLNKAKDPDPDWQMPRPLPEIG